MNAYTCVDPVIRGRDGNPTPHIVRALPVADREYPPNTGIPRTLNDRLPIRIESGVIEMGVRINEHGSDEPSSQTRAVAHVFGEAHQHWLIVVSERSGYDHAVRFHAAEFTGLQIRNDYDFAAD